MRSASWHYFDALYKENKRKIVMKPQNTYPINHDNLNKWYRHMMKSSNGFHQIFGMLFRQELTHVNFATFYEHLLRSAAEIVNDCIEKQRFIILMIEETCLKSPTWIAMLIWPIIKEATVAVESSDTLGDYDTNRMIPVFVDDVSYSGGKLYEYTMSVRNADVPFWVCLSAMSTTARSMMENSLILIPTHVKQFDSIGTVMRKRLPAQYDWTDFNVEIQKLMNDFHTFEDMHAIYFDHKLADAFSIGQYLLATGAFPDADEKPVGPLISGCTEMNYVPKSNGLDYEQEYICPPTFYKSAGFTFKGVPFDSRDTIFDILE